MAGPQRAGSVGRPGGARQGKVAVPRTVLRTRSAPSGADRRRRPHRQHRPLWLLVPGAVLMTVVIVIPFVVAVVISLLDLDQYTFRQWLSAPFIGIDNFVEAVTGSARPPAARGRVP